MADVGIVVGNPKPRSRTLTVAEVVAAGAAERTGLSIADRLVVDLAELGPRLFDWSAPEVRVAVDGIATSRLAVVASPTYKSSYTGLLKSFLDWFGTTGLLGVTVIPLMVGAGLQHALAVEMQLRPVLVEIGATMPTRGLYVTEAQLDQLDQVVDTWLDSEEARLRAALSAGSAAL